MQECRHPVCCEGDRTRSRARLLSLQDQRATTDIATNTTNHYNNYYSSYNNYNNAISLEHLEYSLMYRYRSEVLL